MTENISKIVSSLKQIGEIQVAEWDFMGLLNTEIRELEIGRSLRRLGQIRVTDWNFSNVLPAIRETANVEVDLAGIFRKATRIKVTEWDFRSNSGTPEVGTPESGDAPLEMQAAIGRLRGFLQFVVLNLIDEPKNARISVKQMGPNGLCFKVVMVTRDVAMLIGRDGNTAAAIRRILQATGERLGYRVLLHIHTHEEQTTMGEIGRGRA